MKTRFRGSPRLAALGAALAMVGVLLAPPASADGRHFRGSIGWGRPHLPSPQVHYSGRVNGWWFVGVPLLLFPPYYYPPTVVTQPDPPLVMPDLPPMPQQWYYCDSAASYYPYVQTCSEGWRSVPAQPSGTNIQAAPADTQVWYYCDSAKAYYPYVQRCAENWLPVPAQAPQAAPGTPSKPSAEGAAKP